MQVGTLQTAQPWVDQQPPCPSEYWEPGESPDITPSRQPALVPCSEHLVTFLHPAGVWSPLPGKFLPACTPAGLGQVGRSVGTEPLPGQLQFPPCSPVCLLWCNLAWAAWQTGLCEFVGPASTERQGLGGSDRIYFPTVLEISTDIRD